VAVLHSSARSAMSIEWRPIKAFLKLR